MTEDKKNPTWSVQQSINTITVLRRNDSNLQNEIVKTIFKYFKKFYLPHIKLDMVFIVYEFYVVIRFDTVAQ